MSAGLLTDTAGYFQALADYHEGFAETIIRQFISASFRAIDNSRILAEDLGKVHADWSEHLASRRGSAARHLLPRLLEQPAVNVPSVAATAGVALSAAQRAVGQLEDAGIVQRANNGRRNRVWIAQDVINVLDAFAARAGRRVHG